MHCFSVMKIPWKDKGNKIETNLLFDIIIEGTTTLFTGKSIPIGWDNFREIVKGNCTYIDKTSLISEFLDCDSKVSIVVRPRRFCKTTNLTMLRDFFSIPILPDNENHRHELFKDTKIEERPDIINKYFCKYPVIYLSLKVCGIMRQPFVTVLLICFYLLSFARVTIIAKLGWKCMPDCVRNLRLSMKSLDMFMIILVHIKSHGLTK